MGCFWGERRMWLAEKVKARIVFEFLLQNLECNVKVKAINVEIYGSNLKMSIFAWKFKTFDAESLLDFLWN